MKMRSKESLEVNRMSESFRNAQLRLLNMPPHPGVLAMHEVLEDSKFYYVVMEKASGGSFFNGLMREFKDGVMPPEAVKRLMREIIDAIGHVHQQGMLHRDIKPDNLVMRLFEDPRGSKDPSGDIRRPQASKGRTRRVALIDFDHAELEVDQNGRSWDTAYCGTYQFSAPETFLGKFSYSSDLYSTGVILYLLMTGKMPYDHPVFKDYWEHNRPGGVYHSMKETSVDWSCSPWPEQPECMEFCQWLLAFDSQKRCESAEQALGHEWLVP
jgi:serine/threonine protein kinase